MKQVVNLFCNDGSKLIVVIRIIGGTLILKDLEMNDGQGWWVKAWEM